MSELDQRYARIENELQKYLNSSDSEKNKTKVKANICNIKVVDLENIVNQINSKSISVNDVFFRSIKPVVKTALTTVSVWNYLLDTPTKTIKSIRDYEDGLKNQISEIEEYKYMVKSTMVNLVYIMLFLIKNGVELKVTDILSITTNILDVLDVISDLTENCPLVKNSINLLFGDVSLLDDISDVKGVLSGIVASKSTNTTTLQDTTWNDSYVDSVISAYKRVDTQTLDYNLDGYVEKLIDFTDRLASNYLPTILDALDLEAELLNGLITDSADALVDGIMDLGFGEMVVSKEKLQSCLDVIIKHDNTNRKEYMSYYEKLNRIPKTLGIFSVNKKPYIVNKAKLQLLIIKYYFARAEKDSYDHLKELIDNLDCVVEKTSDELTGKRRDLISKKDERSLRSFTFFAMYYHGSTLILDFMQSQIDNSSLSNNTTFSDYVGLKANQKLKELEIDYTKSLQEIDDSILKAVDEIANNFTGLSQAELSSITNNAKKDLSQDYDDLTKAYNEQVENVYTDTYNYYVDNTSEIEDLALREVVENNSSISKDYVDMRNSLVKYYFDMDKNLGNIVSLLGTKNYRNMIDAIIGKGVNTETDKEVVSFLNDRFIYDVFGDTTVELIQDMGFEFSLDEFVSNVDVSGKTPSLYYMIQKFSESYKLEDKSNNSRNNLKDKLTDLINTYFSTWQKYDIEMIMKEYYSVLKEMHNNDKIIDYNGVKPMLDMLLELAEYSIDDFAETFDDKFEFKNDVYSVDFIDKMFRKANLQINNYINEEL